METLVINIKNKKDSKLIRELLSRLDVEVKETKEELRKKLPKSKFKSEEAFLALRGQ